MKEFIVDRAIEEITIDGKQYEINLSDEKKKRYAEIGTKLQETGSKVESLGKIDNAQALNEQLDLLKIDTKQAMDEILGDGAFETVYEKSNYALENTLDVLFQVLEYINSKYTEKFEKKKAKYVKKKR